MLLCCGASPKSRAPPSAAAAGGTEADANPATRRPARVAASPEAVRKPQELQAVQAAQRHELPSEVVSVRVDDGRGRLKQRQPARSVGHDGPGAAFVLLPQRHRVAHAAAALMAAMTLVICCEWLLLSLLHETPNGSPTASSSFTWGSRSSTSVSKPPDPPPLAFTYTAPAARRAPPALLPWGAFRACASEAGLGQLRLLRLDECVVALAAAVFVALGAARGLSGPAAVSWLIRCGTITLTFLVSAGVHYTLISCLTLGSSAGENGATAGEIVGEMAVGLRFAGRTVGAGLAMWLLVACADFEPQAEGRTEEPDQRPLTPKNGRRWLEHGRGATALRVLGAGVGAFMLLCSAIRITKVWKAAKIAELSRFPGAQDPFAAAELDAWNAGYTIGPSIGWWLRPAAETAGGEEDGAGSAALAKRLSVPTRLWGSDWLGEMAVLAMAGRRQVDGGDLFLTLTSQLAALPGAAACRWWHADVWDSIMPDAVHPNFNWLRGSRWGWEDGHVAITDLSTGLFGSGLDKLAAAAAARVQGAAGAGRVRFATLRDDGVVLTAAADGAEAEQDHARSVGVAALSMELHRMKLPMMRRLAIARGVDADRIDAVLYGAEPKEILAALILARKLPWEKSARSIARAPAAGEGSAGALEAERCVPCVGGGGFASTVCGRWSANATHVFVAWKGCGLHILQLASNQPQQPRSTALTHTTALVGTRAAAEAPGWFGFGGVAVDVQGAAVAAVGGSRKYQGAPKWRRAG